MEFRIVAAALARLKWTGSTAMRLRRAPATRILTCYHKARPIGAMRTQKSPEANNPRGFLRSIRLIRLTSPYLEVVIQADLDGVHAIEVVIPTKSFVRNSIRAARVQMVVDAEK